MKTISKTVRNKAYKSILSKLQRGTIGIFICNELLWYVEDNNLLDDNYIAEEIVEFFPEFKKFKRKPPIPAEGGWWPQNDIASRIKALEKCIKLTARKKSK